MELPQPEQQDDCAGSGLVPLQGALHCSIPGLESRIYDKVLCCLSQQDLASGEHQQERRKTGESVIGVSALLAPSLRLS